MSKMASPIDQRKLHYLGRGVDCRKGRKEWWTILDRPDGDQIREIDEKCENVRDNPLCTSEVTIDRSEKDKDVGSSNKIMIKPAYYTPLELGVIFDAERYTKQTKKQRRLYHETRTATLLDDIKHDPKAIKKASSTGFEIWYSKFEQNLCAYILMMKETDFREFANSEPVQSDPIVRFNELTKLVEKNKEKSARFWRIVTDACIAFLEKKQYTHYVYSITLGAEQLETDTSNASKLSLVATAQASAMQEAGFSETAKWKTQGQQHSSRISKRGRIEEDSGSVHTEEVIGIRMKPIFKLLRDKSALQIIMQNVLESYNTLKAGDVSGPYQIFCKEMEPSNTGVRDIYWCVHNGEIHGTPDSDKASHFYIEIFEEDPLFYIIHKKDTTKLKVKVKQPYNSHLPLQLVLHGLQTSDLIYTLQSTADGNAKFPSSPFAWKNYSPFLIKQPGKWWGINKAARYIKMKKHSETSMPEYQTATSSAIDTDNSLMLFYIRKVIELPDEHGCVPLSTSGPLPTPTTEPDDIRLWMVQEDQEDTKSMFYELVGTDKFLL